MDLLHDGRHISLEGLVDARKEGQAVFLDLLEIFWRVDTSLVEDPGKGTTSQRILGNSAWRTDELTEYSKNSVTIFVEPLRLSVCDCFRFVAMAGGEC